MNPIVLDIETRPDPAIADSVEWWEHRREKVQPDGRLTDLIKIAADIDKKLDVERTGLALSQVGAIVACIGWQAWNDEEPTVLTAREFNRQGELVLLREFAAQMPQHRDILVTWYGRRFDVPMLIARCMVQNIRLPWWPKPRDYRYHVDLNDDLGLERGLGDWQFVMGGGFKQVDGAKLLELSAEELALHCREDVEQTVIMAHRTSHVWMPRTGGDL
jgi:uncharacterized protein YprB with RNaseH-like and TPR domain